jgi:hypothetical protein
MGRNQARLLTGRRISGGSTVMNRLLIRIQAETLRRNLESVHKIVETLPGLPGDIEGLATVLSEIRRSAQSVARDLNKLQEEISDHDEIERSSIGGPLRTSRDKVEQIGDQLSKARGQLEEIKKSSFVVKMSDKGKIIADTNLKTETQNLIQIVSEIECDIDTIGSEGRTWSRLSKARREASIKVFDQSIEFLGGIALRNTRLGSNICELADSMIASIHRGKASSHVIPGGVATMMMTFQHIVRLPFPGWNIWALPFAAHEFCHAALKDDLQKLRVIKEAEAEVIKLLGTDGAHRCLADIFATYTLGPAYAYAAITLLFDPTSIVDEARVQSISQTLSAMNPSNEEGPEESYLTIAGELQEEWDLGRAAAFKAIATDTDVLDTQIKALQNLNPCPKKPEGVGYQTKIDELRILWEAAARDPQAPDLRIDPEPISKLVSVLHKQLSLREINSFSFAQWSPLSEWAEKLNAGAIDEIKTDGFDIRHALNAAWLARIHAAPTSNADLEISAMELANRVRERIPGQVGKKIPGDPW